MCMSGQWIPTSKECFLWFDFPYFLKCLHSLRIHQKDYSEQVRICYSRALGLTLGSPKCVDEERSGLRASCTKLSTKLRCNQTLIVEKDEQEVNKKSFRALP